MIDRTTLFAALDALGIPHSTTEHEAVFTVEQSAGIKDQLPGAHTKNLFLKAKDGALFLICARADTVIRLNKLHGQLNSKRLSFGSAERLKDALGVTPGSVTFFSILNDPQGEVSLVLDKALLGHKLVNFHPLINTATTSIPSDRLVDFARTHNHDPVIIDFTRLQDHGAAST